MARIAGVDLPRNKQARIALTYIYGIGNPRSLKILEKANVDAFKKIQDLGEEEVNRIRQVIETRVTSRAICVRGASGDRAYSEGEPDGSSAR